MRTHRTLVVAALVLAALAAVVGTSSAAGCGGHGQRGCRMGPDGAALKPAFTAEQQEQIDKIATKYQDQRVELHNRIGVTRLEIQELLSQAEPDFGKVEAKIDAISELHAKLAKMRLQQHKEIRGTLTPEQRTLFDRGFADKCCDGGGPGGGPMACGMMGGGTMGCGGAAGCAAKMGADSGAPGSCPMMGAAGPMRGPRPQAGEWRRWL